MKNLLPLLLSVLIFTSCSKKDPEPEIIIDAPTLDLKYDQQHQYALKKGSDDIFASTFTWKSSDDKVGTIDANGRFSARKIGVTIISGTESGTSVESKVTVSPRVTLFTEPVIEFGATKADIKSKEKRKLLQETDEGLAYEGQSGTQTRGVVYLFPGGKMSGAIMLFDNATSTATISSTFIKERYPDRETQDGKVYILNDERTMGIIMSVDADYGYMAMYLPFTPNGRIQGSNYVLPNEFKHLFKTK
jgi:hypothetical protein